VTKYQYRRSTAFITVMLACLAFLVGAVKIWGVVPEKIWSGLLAIVIMLGGLIVLALLAVVLLNLVRKFYKK